MGDNVVFWILYIIGGVPFFGLLILDNLIINKKRFNLISSFPRLLQYFTIAEGTWVLFWLIGYVLRSSREHLLLGILPCSILLITWLSYSMVIVREAYAQKRKNNVMSKRISPIINKWLDDITDDTLILNEIFWDLNERNNRLRGKIVIKVQGGPAVDWNQEAAELKKQISKGISLEVVSNDVLVYPKYPNADDHNNDQVIH
ncbi:hypothetical protein MKX42_22130 [Paenibacillus sp. FSL R7-0204]|uniref:hypothetical protein n=1 Tax=Paenibacillus sp. FSL R7-0204 TaxID=2921675 RepID=UPI0030F57469